MGNSLLRCFTGDRDDHHRHSYSPPHRFPQNLGPHGVTQATVGVAALASDLLNFEITSQVPEGLNPYVVSSKKAQAIWYKKLLEAWRQTRPVPSTPEAAATLVVQTLRRNQGEDVKGILDYYGLPVPLSLPPETSSQPESSSSSWPQGVQYEFYTLPVDAKTVVDGDGITVYVDTSDPKESKEVPFEVQEAAIERSMARAEKDYKKADSLLKSIHEAGYRFIKSPDGEETLARKHRIRLRGVDAPEGPQPFGKEAKEALLKLTEGKRLKIQVYNMDQYGRLIGDVYCNGIFVQEQMLKRGLAMHYTTFDKRPEFAKWQGEAKAAGRGLWASPNPEEPWEWRKRNDGWRGKNNIPVQVY